MEEEETESNEEGRLRFYLFTATFPANHSVSLNSRNFRVEVFFAVMFRAREEEEEEEEKKTKEETAFNSSSKANKRCRNFLKFRTDECNLNCAR